MKEQLSFIWAEDLNGGIGYHGGMPWHLKADLKHFKQTTLGHPVIMGAKTMKSIGRPLPGRTNLVLTHHQVTDPNWVTLPNLSALDHWLAVHPDSTPFVIGGAGVYRQLLSRASRLYRTVVLDHFKTDTKMPPINYDQWHLLKTVSIQAADSEPAARFEDWELVSNKG